MSYTIGKVVFECELYISLFTELMIVTDDILYKIFFEKNLKKLHENIFMCLKTLSGHCLNCEIVYRNTDYV